MKNLVVGNKIIIMWYVVKIVVIKIIPYGTKFWWGKILTNGHVENFDENFFDEFHNVNAHIY